jgi:hypothetical protein
MRAKSRPSPHAGQIAALASCGPLHQAAARHPSAARHVGASEAAILGAHRPVCRFHATEAGSLSPPEEMHTEIIELRTLAKPKRSQFGEFLVTHAVIDRYQLFRVLQMQDRVPGARLGQCAVALGYVPRDTIEQLHLRFSDRDAELDTMPTEAFHREPDIEIIFDPFSFR